jgi:phosphoribosyl-ATP pyrophosphohydrolase
MANAITEGTQAQIEWAVKLVEAEVTRIDAMLAPVPAKEGRSEILQKLYGEEIALVKTVRNTLAKRVQSAKWVIDNRNNLFYHTAALLRKQDESFKSRFPEELIYRVVASVNDGNWLKGAGF